jgi:hypothetical protein
MKGLLLKLMALTTVASNTVESNEETTTSQLLYNETSRSISTTEDALRYLQSPNYLDEITRQDQKVKAQIANKNKKKKITPANPVIKEGIEKFFGDLYNEYGPATIEQKIGENYVHEYLKSYQEKDVNKVFGNTSRKSLFYFIGFPQMFFNFDEVDLKEFTNPIERNFIAKVKDVKEANPGIFNFNAALLALNSLTPEEKKELIKYNKEENVLKTDIYYPKDIFSNPQYFYNFPREYSDKFKGRMFNIIEVTSDTKSKNNNLPDAIKGGKILGKPISEDLIDLMQQNHHKTLKTANMFFLAIELDLLDNFEKTVINKSTVVPTNGTVVPVLPINGTVPTNGTVVPVLPINGTVPTNTTVPTNGTDTNVTATNNITVPTTNGGVSQGAKTDTSSKDIGIGIAIGGTAVAAVVAAVVTTVYCKKKCKKVVEGGDIEMIDVVDQEGGNPGSDRPLAQGAAGIHPGSIVSDPSSGQIEHGDIALQVRQV